MFNLAIPAYIPTLALFCNAIFPILKFIIRVLFVNVLLVNGLLHSNSQSEIKIENGTRVKSKVPFHDRKKYFFFNIVNIPCEYIIPSHFTKESENKLRQ